MTTLQLITNALIEINYLASGESPLGPEQQRALAIVQRLVNSAGADRLTIFEVLRTATTLTSGTRDYTIGTGGTINIVRPNWIDRAGFILDSTVTDPIEIPIDVYTADEWALVSMKTLDTSVIQGMFYDYAFASTQRATISTYPTVNVANTQLVLYTPRALTGFVALATDYTFPPGYDEAWHFELAYQLQRPFGKPSDPELRDQRREAWARVKRANFRPIRLHLDHALTGTGGTMTRAKWDSGNF